MAWPCTAFAGLFPDRDDRILAVQSQVEETTRCTTHGTKLASRKRRLTQSLSKAGFWMGLWLAFGSCSGFVVGILFFCVFWCVVVFVVFLFCFFFAFTEGPFGSFWLLCWFFGGLLERILCHRGPVGFSQTFHATGFWRRPISKKTKNMMYILFKYIEKLCTYC